MRQTQRARGSPSFPKNISAWPKNTLDSNLLYTTMIMYRRAWAVRLDLWSFDGVERICRPPRQVAKKPRAGRSRILDRFEGPKAESEITMKKLGAKNAKTTTQAEKRAGVISLRNTIFGIPATGPHFSRRIVGPKPGEFHPVLRLSKSEREFSVFFENRKIEALKLLPAPNHRVSSRGPRAASRQAAVFASDNLSISPPKGSNRPAQASIIVRGRNAASRGSVNGGQ